MNQQAANAEGYKKRRSWLSGTYLRPTLDVPGSDVDRTVFLRDLLTFFFWLGDERFLFDWTALTAIFYCTPDATSPAGKPGLDYLDGDFLLVWLRRYWRAKRPYGPTPISVFHLCPLIYLFWVPLNPHPFWLLPQPLVAASTPPSCCIHTPS